MTHPKLRGLALVTTLIGNGPAQPVHQFVHPASLIAVAKQCHVPAGWTVIDPSQFVRIRPGNHATYGDIMCLIGELRRRHVPMAEARVGSVR